LIESQWNKKRKTVNCPENISLPLAINIPNGSLKTMVNAICSLNINIFMA
jgi:hypothetical protein